MIKIEQLFYLTQVAKYNSINKTAENLYMTSAAISTSIKQLEKECGFEVLERTYRGVKLTEYGKEVVGIAEQILALEEKIKALKSEKVIEPVYQLFIDSRTLKLMSEKVVGPRSKVLSYFHIKEIDNLNMSYSQYLDEKSVVLTLFTAEQREELENDNSISIRYLYASKCYPVSSKTTKWVRSNQNYISAAEFEKLPKILMRNEFENTVKKNVVLSTDDTSIYAEAIQNDYGVGLIAKFAPDIRAFDYEKFKVYEPFNQEYYIAALAKRGDMHEELILLEKLIKG